MENRNWKWDLWEAVINDKRWGWLDCNSIMYTFEMDFWSSREIRDKERPLNVDSTFKRLSRRLLHCRSLVKIHARSNCEGYPSMDNIHQQSWATTRCPFSLWGKHTQRGLIHFLAHSRVFIHTITYHMVTHCIQICHPCLHSWQNYIQHSPRFWNNLLTSSFTSDKFLGQGLVSILTLLHSQTIFAPKTHKKLGKKRSSRQFPVVSYYPPSPQTTALA